MASSNAPVLPKNMNIDNVTIGALKTLPNGVASFAPLLFEDEMFTMQIPEMYSPFGVNQYQQDNGNIKYSIQLSFDGIENRVSLQVFKKLFEDIDNKVTQHAFEYSNEFFKKKFTSVDVIKETIFNPSIKYPIDKITREVSTQWAPKIKIDLEMRKGEFMFQCFDKKRNPMDILGTDMKRAKMTMIIQCGGIWVAGGKFGIKWKAKQILCKPAQNFKQFAFVSNPEDNIDDDDDDDDDIKNDIVSNTNALLINDDDDDDL
jgi:hypothetical protein